MKTKLIALLFLLFSHAGFANQDPALMESPDSLLERVMSILHTDPKRALALTDSALTATNNTGDFRLVQARIHKVRARLFAEKGEYVNAVESALIALEVFQEMDLPEDVCTMFVHLGVISRYRGQLEQSLGYYRQAEQLAMRHDYSRLKAVIWGNMGNVYYDLNNYEEALNHHNKSLEIDRARKNAKGISTSLHNLGNVYRAEGLYERALEYYRQSLAFELEQGDLRSIGVSYLDLTEIHLEIGQIEEALLFATKAMEIVAKTESKRLKSEIMGYLPLIHASLGNTNAAIEAFHDHREVMDSLQAESISEQIAAMRAKYEADQKEKEVEVLDLQVTAQQSSLRQQRRFIIILVAFLLLAGTVAFLLFNRYKLQQRNHRLELELEARQIRQMDEIKSRFFANISHEFRTPLNLILAPLQQRRDSIPAREIGLMRRNAKRLLRLVNQLLDLARIEVGLMKTANQNVEVSGLISAIANSFTPLAEMQKIHYQIDIPERDYVVSIDPDKVEKIVYNLLSNAFKFTPEGGKVSIHLTMEASGQLHLTVSDTGIGIAQELLDKVFDRFYQADTSRTRAYEGTGIGLALTKELVELFGGKIKVDSQEGKGSTFSVHLPVQVLTEEHEEIIDVQVSEPVLLPEGQVEEQAAYIAVDEANSSGTAGEKPLLLVVEDNLDLRHYLRDQLAGEHIVLEAVDGRQGLQVALGAHPGPDRHRCYDAANGRHPNDKNAPGKPKDRAHPNSAVDGSRR